MEIIVVDAVNESPLCQWGMVMFQLALACTDAGVPMPWRRSARFKDERAVA